MKKTKQGVLRRKEILLFIDNYSRQRGYSPTFREIGAGVGLKSTSTVANHIQKLREENLLTTELTKPRTLRRV